MWRKCSTKLTFVTCFYCTDTYCWHSAYQENADCYTFLKGVFHEIFDITGDFSLAEGNQAEENDGGEEGHGYCLDGYGGQLKIMDNMYTLDRFKTTEISKRRGGHQQR